MSGMLILRYFTKTHRIWSPSLEEDDAWRRRLLWQMTKCKVVKISNGDIISGLRRSPAAEIDILPLPTTIRTHTTCVQYRIDSKHVLNARRKPWSINRMVESLPVCDVIQNISHATHVNTELKNHEQLRNYCSVNRSLIGSRSGLALKCNYFLL